MRAEAAPTRCSHTYVPLQLYRCGAWLFCTYRVTAPCLFFLSVPFITQFV